MRILVIYNNDVSSCELIDSSTLCLNSRKSIENVALAVSSILSQDTQNDVRLAGITSLLELKTKILELEPELVFNLCESIDANASQEVDVVELLESFNIPFTGNGSVALKRCLDKFECNNLLTQVDLPAPKSILISTYEECDSFEFESKSYIIKPNDEDGSTAIDFCSVVNNLEQLKRKVKELLSNSPQRLIVQEYINGREINLAFAGNHYCASEIIFTFKDPNKPKILNYASKWIIDSDDFKETNSSHADLSDELKERLVIVAKKARETLNLSSYGRIDFKIDENQTPFIIDVNPNCDLDQNAGMAKAFGYASLNYNTLIDTIIKQAIYDHKKT